MRRPVIIAAIALSVLGGVAWALYANLDPAAATFLLAAGCIVSICAASTTLLAAYSRRIDRSKRR